MLDILPLIKKYRIGTMGGFEREDTNLFLGTYISVMTARLSRVFKIWKFCMY